MKLYLTGFAAIVILIVVIGLFISSSGLVLVSDTITILRFLLYSAGLFSLTLGLAYTLFWCLTFSENWRIKRAERRKAEKEAATPFIIESAQHGIFAYDRDPHSIWKALHLNPAYRQNGQAAEHNEMDVALWQAFTLRNRQVVKPPDQKLLEAKTILRTAFDLWKEAIHLALIGGTGSGKTTLANHLIEYIGIDTLILDPHANLNTWTTQATVIYQYNEIEEALRLETEEMKQRYDNGITSPAHLIVLDEWPAIVDECPQAGEYLKRLSREGRKVNICLILLSQSDLIQDLGTNTSVRENFLRIFLRADLTKQNRALIRHWDNTREEIELSGEYVNNQMDEFVRLVGDGLSRSEASRQAFGKEYAGSSHVNRCRKALLSAGMEE